MNKKNAYTLTLAVFSLIVLGGAILPAAVEAASGAAIPNLFDLFPSRRGDVSDAPTRPGTMAATTAVITGSVDQIDYRSQKIILNVLDQDSKSTVPYGIDASQAKISIGLNGASGKLEDIQQKDMLTVHGSLFNRSVVADAIYDQALLKRNLYQGIAYAPGTKDIDTSNCRAGDTVCLAFRSAQQDALKNFTADQLKDSQKTTSRAAGQGIVLLVNKATKGVLVVDMRGAKIIASIGGVNIAISYKDIFQGDQLQVYGDIDRAKQTVTASYVIDLNPKTAALAQKNGATVIDNSIDPRAR